MKMLSYVLISVILISCVSESDYQKLKDENEKLKAENEELRSLSEDLKTLSEEIKAENQEFKREKEESNPLLNLFEEISKEQEQKQKEAPEITEEQALEFIEDYYSFYDRDTKYRNIKLRRTAKNSFAVSVEECSISCDDDYFWDASVRSLQVFKDGEYEYN